MSNPNVKTKPSTGNVIDHSDETNTTFSVGGAQSVMPANPSRTYLVFQNISDTEMFLNFGAVAFANKSIKVSPSGSVTFNSAWIPSQEVFLRCSSDGKYFVAKEGI